MEKEPVAQSARRTHKLSFCAVAQTQTLAMRTNTKRTKPTIPTARKTPAVQAPRHGVDRPHARTRGGHHPPGDARARCAIWLPSPALTRAALSLSASEGAVGVLP